MGIKPRVLEAVSTSEFGVGVRGLRLVETHLLFWGSEADGGDCEGGGWERPSLLGWF